jgi:hypothetical protein
MRILACSIFFWMVLAAPIPVLHAQPGDPVIIMPRPEEALQGLVQITGSSDVPGFAFSEISFTYAVDSTGTWFLIAADTQPVADGALAIWDTTAISDGEYVLRLRVTLTDGSSHDAIIPGLRVRNYTPVETPTPAPVVPDATSRPTITPTSTPVATPTNLPHNPAELGPMDVSASLLYGGMTAVVIFVIISVYLWLRRKLS